jgi:hypothetical protein
MLVGHFLILTRVRWRQCRDYDDYHDIYMQRWRKEDTEWKVGPPLPKQPSKTSLGNPSDQTCLTVCPPLSTTCR